VRAASVAGSASSAGLLRIATLTGVTAPAFCFGMGDLLLLVSLTGSTLAHVSARIQPGMIFSYHGRDPMQHRTRNNFSAVVTSAGLIKPTTMAGDHGHLGCRALAFAPNQTCRDFSCNFEWAADQQLGRRPAAQAPA
jgi:hypothetical protein